MDPRGRGDWPESGPHLPEEKAEATPPPLQGLVWAGLVQGQGVQAPVAPLPRVLPGPRHLHMVFTEFRRNFMQQRNSAVFRGIPLFKKVTTEFRKRFTPS